MNSVVRVLLCIGCDDYTFMDRLSGAELDARNMFLTLTSEEYGGYERQHAELLLSPTFVEIAEVIDRLMPVSGEVDLLTVFFAGHGVLSRGNYYLCAKETQPNRYSTTGWALSRLFEIINEKAPTHCNIILDSCQSGGLVADLNSFIKPELIGAANSTGVAIFATSAANEYSIDSSEGGVGTLNLLRVLRGEILVQTREPFLDLVEAGRAAAKEISKVANEIVAVANPDCGLTLQTPVVWGMNLFGQSVFARNPLYDKRQPVSIHQVTSISSGSDAGRVISDVAHKIWALYYTDTDLLTPRKVYAALVPIVDQLNNVSDIVNFLKGVFTALVSKVESSGCSFVSVEVLAVNLTLLLHARRFHEEIDRAIDASCISLLEQLSLNIDSLLDVLRSDDERLVAHGLPDFFYLPVRLTKILGWAFLSLLLKRELNLETDSDCMKVTELVDLIVRKYSSCLEYVSDEQTPYLMVCFAGAKQYELNGQLEQIFGHFAHSLFVNKGRVGAPSLSGRDAYRYIKCRILNDFEGNWDILAVPNEALSLILIGAEFVGLSDSIDDFLGELDHQAHSIFVPESYLDFSEEVISSGCNHNFQIGHGVWRVSDLINRWESVCKIQLSQDQSLRSSSVRIAAVCAAFSFPDRSPWFLFF